MEIFYKNIFVRSRSHIEDNSSDDQPKRKFGKKRRKWHGVEKFYEAKNLMVNINKNFRRRIKHGVSFFYNQGFIYVKKVINLN